MFAAGNAFAAPTGGEVVGGSGSIEQQGTHTTIIQESERLAVDWQSFDVSTNERVEFVQPGQSAVALNRILGNKGSEILGRIDANGHVILVNPRGVVFGEGAVINAGGLIASGLQINPEDLMNGDLVFKRIEGMDSTVINSGMINAASGGNVALLGARVENRGLISAKLGSVILASGKEAVLTFDEFGLLGVRVDQAILQEELGETAAVKNAGEILAESGRVLLSATTTRDVFSQAVNWGNQQQARSVTFNEDGSFSLGAGGNIENSGTLNVSGEHSAGIVVAVAENVTHTGLIRADSQRGQGGSVELHSNTTTRLADDGVVTASGVEGGDIKLLGKNVGLFDQAAVNAVGANGGGTVLIGGDREGLNTEVRNADFVYVGKGTLIDASAKDIGDGGVVVTFAEDTARIYGALSARGGTLSGDGGFVETSGRLGFEIGDSPDLSANEGVGGHWLIDPYNITITDDTNTGFPDTTPQNPFVSTGSNAILDYRTLQGALARGGVVTVQTGPGNNGEDGDITVAFGINLTTNVTATLNLIAHNDIIINANITTGDKNANRKLNLHLNANTSGNDGSITFGNNVRIETGGGNFVVGQIAQNGSVNPDLPGAYNVNFSNATIDVVRAAYSNSELDQFYRNHGTAVTRDQSQHLAPSGRIVINADYDVTLGQMKIKGREAQDAPAKVAITAGHDIVLSQDLLFDNNPTEILQPNQRSNDGYTTLQLIADNHINLNGRIRREFPNTPEGWQDHQDRLRIELTADNDRDGGGDVTIGNSQETEIETVGGDFIIHNAVNVDLSGRTIDTRSPYGAGNVSITASGNVTLGNLPMFEQAASNTAGPLRNPSLTAIAGDTLTLGGANLYTRDGGINLGAAQWNFNSRSLNTTQGGSVTLTSAGNLALPTIVSSGNLTLASRDAGQAISITGGARLNGLLTLDLKAGSANLTNLVNNASGSVANVVIKSGQNIQLQTPQSIRLGESALTGNLSLTSGAGISQLGNTHINVGGDSRFYVDDNGVVLRSVNNIFVGSVWVGGTGGGDVQDVDLAAQNLRLGNSADDMTVTGTFNARAGGNITQAGILAVTGTTTLSAGGSITLTQNNEFSSIGISQAQSAEIHNQQNLGLGSIGNVGQLTLDVTGNLSQSAALTLDELILAVTGETLLTQQENRIAALSGTVVSGEINSAGDMQLGNFTVGNGEGISLHLSGNDAQFSQTEGSTFTSRSPTTVSAAHVTLNANVEFTSLGALTFNEVSNFVLSGNLQGQDATENSIVINGTSGNGIYEITADASWENVAFNINGGNGTDTLQGPDLTATWHIGAAEPHRLVTAQGEVSFRGMESLQGGSEADTFAFAAGAVTTLSLSGGNGRDVADYSGITGDITVPLGVSGGLSGIELIRGNNDGAGTTNSALTAQGNTANTWVINALNAGQVTPAGGTVMAFEGFNQLVGGGGQDNFTFSANLSGASAQADGAGGDDIFNVLIDITANLVGGEGADRFNLAAATLGSLFGGDGNDTFVLSEDARVAALDGGDGLNTLVGFDADLAWDIYASESDGSAVVDVYDDSAVYVAEAAKITGVQGGSGDDTFFFLLNNSGVGADGGEGENTADFSAVTGNLTVNLGGLDQLGLSNIAGVVGNYQPMGVSTSTLGIVSGGANRWTLNAPDAGRVQLADGDTISFRNFNNFLGGEGADRFDISATPAGLINGRGGNDSFYLLASGISAALFGGDGNDTLVAYQQSANTWELSAGISYLRSAGSDVAFTGMDVLRGAVDFADTFIFLNSVVPQPTIVAGDGEAIDTIDYSLLTGQAIEVILGGSGLTGFESVIGNGATSTLIGANQASDWTLDENGEGQVSWAGQTTLFSGFGHWVGGSAADRFVLATLTGAPASIRGGGSADVLDMAAVNQVLWVGLGMGTGAPLTVTEVETITANPLHSNRLTSAANQAGWVINARNAGTLTQDGGSAIGFSGFAHLHGLHANTFDLQANGVLVAEDGAGSVQGGDGNSLLKVDGNTTHAWALNGAGTGSLARGESELLGFVGLTALEGGDGRDDFVLTDPAASIGRIDGGGGTNSLSAAWSSNTLLEWKVADGQGELVNHVAQFLRIAELVGQGGADDFQISGNSSLVLIDSGAGDDLIHLSNTSRVATVRAGDGSDIISLSDSASVTDPIDGGGHPADGGDRLNLADYGSGVIWNAAEQRIGGFTYRNIEQIDAPTGFANTFQAPDSVNTWTISGSNSGVLSTGDGQNLIFTAIAQLLGGSLEDIFILSEEGSITGSIDGGGGTNYLQGNDVANQWTVTGLDSGRLESNGAPSVASFERIQHLLGGNGTDQFEITAAGRLTGGLEGNGGADTLISQRTNQSWWIADDVTPGRLEGGDEVTLVSFTGVETLAGSGSDILRGGDQDREWRLDNPGAGSLDSGAISVAFSGFSDLIGGAGSDSFVVGENGAIAGVIDGGNGVNSILFERQGAVSVTLDMNRQIANAFKVQRVQTIEAADGFNHNLYGASDNAAGYNWIVSGPNRGLVSLDGEDESQIQFINFANLFGGGRSDSFRIDGGVLASIDGGGGDDFLDYSAYEGDGDLTVTIGEHLGADFTIKSIEGVVGNDDGSGAGKAILRASNGTNVWTILGGGDPGQDGINDGVFEQVGGDRIVFRDFSYLQGGSGDDRFVLQDQGILTGSIRDNGGNNTLDLKATELPLRTVVFATENPPRGRRENELFVQGIQTLEGRGVATTLIGPDVDTRWLINNRNAGELNYLDRKVTFTGFGNVSGGAAADVFSVSSAGAMSGWFSGGDGTARDQINFTSQLPVSVWSAGTAPTESGWHWLNGGFDVVTAPANAQNQFASDSSRAQVWNFSGTNSGTVAEVDASAALSFSGFGRLLGGQGDDEFVFAAGSNLTGLLDGGEGTNSVDLEALTASISVSIGNRENADLRIDRIQRIAANEDPARNNWLRGADQNNQWKISGANAGELNGSVQFSGFANLRGGAADDQFIFQQLGGLSGQIDGDAHDQGDVVDYGSLIEAVLVDLSGAA
ncbi:MAG: filamentous hemagglutinin N-terminal domain-containing protein [Cellvibrionaceae bacterium]|nr:filamentous hemagglutinin N-terminal domain-containing protein [Cellvibrionaceae bacterium]